MSLLQSLDIIAPQNRLYLSCDPYVFSDEGYGGGCLVFLMNEDATLMDSIYLADIEAARQTLSSVMSLLFKHRNTCRATIQACVVHADKPDLTKYMQDLLTTYPMTRVMCDKKGLGVCLFDVENGHADADHQRRWFIDMHQNRWRYGPKPQAMQSYEIIKQLRSSSVFNQGLNHCLLLRKVVIFDPVFSQERYIKSQL